MLRLMRMVQTEPKIEITVRLLEYAIHLARIHVRNIGLGPALAVKLSVSVVPGGEPGRKRLSEFTKPEFFRTGLSYLGPGQERVSHFSEMNKNHEEKTSVVLAFKVMYRTVTGQDYVETHVSRNFVEHHSWKSRIFTQSLKAWRSYNATSAISSVGLSGSGRMCIPERIA